MTLTATYIDENWKLQSRVLIFYCVPPPHNGPVLGNYVKIQTKSNLIKTIYIISKYNNLQPSFSLVPTDLIFHCNQVQISDYKNVKKKYMGIG